MRTTTRVPLSMFTQGGRRILIGRDDATGETLVVARDREGYLLTVAKDAAELRALLDNKDANLNCVFENTNLAGSITKKPPA